MAYAPRQMPKVPAKQTVTMVFGNVAGVDFRSDNPESNRTPDSVNMYRSRLGLWETHVGFRRIGYVGRNVPVWGIHKFVYRDEYGDNVTKVLVHAGTKMYTWDNYPDEYTPNTLTEIFSGMASTRSKYVEFNNFLIVCDGEALYYYDGEVFDYVSHKAYLPHTLIGKSPDGKTSTEYQQRNYLNRWVQESFAADGTSVDYYLGMQNLDKDTLQIWSGAEDPSDPSNVWYTEKVSATTSTDFQVDRVHGKVTFNTAPASSPLPGVDNIYIRYAKSSKGYFDRINKCTEIMSFDNRIFITGNPAYPNMVYWSANEDWTYFGELDCSEKAGTSSSPILALQRLQENKFLSIKGDTDQDGAYTEWTQYSLNSDYIAETYVTSTGNATIGCVSTFAHKVFVDDNVYLSHNGLNAISRNLSVSYERNLEHRSTLVDSKLLAEDLESAIMEQHRGYLYILFPNGHCYVANSQYRANDVSDSTEYEWAYLENIGARHGDVFYAPTQLVSVNDKELYLCSSEGHLLKFFFDLEGADGSYPQHAYTFDGEKINEYVDTPFSWFGVQNRFKKLNRKYNDLYCDIRTTSDIQVLFHTEKKLMDNSKVLSYKANIFTFNDVDFSYEVIDDEENIKSDFTFNTIPPVSFVLKKLKGKRFRRLQLRIKSGETRRPVIFRSLVVEAYILTRKLK